MYLVSYRVDDIDCWMGGVIICVKKRLCCMVVVASEL